MNWFERWAAGSLTVYVADARQQHRERVCRLLRMARLDCREFGDGAAAIAAMGADSTVNPAPDMLVTDLGGGQHCLRIARVLRPGLVVIGLSPLIRINTGMQFSPLRDLLGADYLLPRPVDPAELLATVVLAASEVETIDADAVATAS